MKEESTNWTKVIFDQDDLEEATAYIHRILEEAQIDGDKLTISVLREKVNDC